MSNRQIAKFSRHSRRYVNGVLNRFNVTGIISIPRHVKPHSVRSSLSELDMDWIIRVSSEEPATTPSEMCNILQVEMGHSCSLRVMPKAFLKGELFLFFVGDNIFITNSGLYKF
jgi:transposase